MKYIFLFFILIMTINLNSQTWTQINGKQRFTSGLGIPVKDSLNFIGSNDTAIIFINTKDTSSIYWRYKGNIKKIINNDTISLSETILQSQKFNKSTPDNLSVSASAGIFTFSQSNLTITNGVGGYNNKISFKKYTILQNYTISSGKFVSTSSGNGFGIGIDCAYTESIIAQAATSTGKVNLIKDKTTTTSSDSTLVFSSTDSLELILNVSFLRADAYLINHTTRKKISVSVDYTNTGLTGSGLNMNRTGLPTMWAFGGTQIFGSGSEFIYKTTEPRNAKLAIGGTSIEYGYSSGTVQNRWAYLGGRAKFPFFIWASASARTQDIVNALPELEILKPEFVAFSIGVNDTLQGIANSITYANYDSIASFCNRVGIKYIFQSVLPMTSPFTAYNPAVIRYNNYIQRLKGITKYIDAYTNVPITTVDGVHPDATTHAALSDYFVTQTNSLFKYYFPNTDIAVNKSTTWNLKIGGASALQSVSDRNLLLMNNAYYDGSAYKAFTTGSASWLNFNDGVINLASSTSTTAGASITSHKYPLSITNTGVSVGGLGNTSILTPISTLHVNQVAGTTKGISITGDEVYATGNGSSTTGVRLAVGVSRATNRQLWVGDIDAFGSSTLSIFRLQTGISGYAGINAVTGNGTTTLPIVLGSNTANTGIGYDGDQSMDITKYTAQLNVFTNNDNRVSLLLKKFSANTGNFIETRNSSNVLLSSIDKDGVLLASQYKLSALNTAPSSATATGTTGEIRITSDYIYVCVATNTWVRAALGSW